MSNRWILRLNHLLKWKRGSQTWFGKEGNEFVLRLIELLEGCKTWLERKELVK